MKKRNLKSLVSVLLAVSMLLTAFSCAFADEYYSNSVSLGGMVVREPKPTPKPTPEATEEPTAEPTPAPAESAPPELTVEPDETPAPTQEPEYQVDEDGNLILDENGNPIPVEKEEEVPAETEAPAEDIEYQVDENGNLILDENGNPIPVEKEEEVPAEEIPAEETKIVYAKDENGALILDEAGNPIIEFLPEGMTAPAAYERDENGALVLDANGDPIPAAAEAPAEPEIPAEETKIMYAKDESGALILDEAGNPIIEFLPEGMTAPAAYERDENGNLILDENGDPIPAEDIPAEELTPAEEAKIIYAKDENGALILDEAGNPIIEFLPEGMTAPAAYQRDENGALVLDVSGDPIPVVEEVPAEEEKIIYKKDENGNLILDENGEPIIEYLPEGFERPIDYVRDENGNLVLDENGDPIPAHTLPDGSTLIGSLADLLDPDCRIDMYLVTPADQLFFGEPATMAAVLYGFENAVYTLQWETSVDGESWQPVEGATGEKLTTVVTEENYMNYWRVTALITDVIQSDDAVAAEAPAQDAPVAASAE